MLASDFWVQRIRWGQQLSILTLAHNKIGSIWGPQRQGLGEGGLRACALVGTIETSVLRVKISAECRRRRTPGH